MFRSVRLPQGISGRLYLHSMPGRRESWDDFVSEAKQQGIDVIVCLTSDDEIQEKSAAYANAISNNLLNCKTESYPILDYGVPEDQGVFAVFIRRIAELLRSGSAVLAHCGAGIGRTGTFAICLLIALGMNRNLAERTIRDAGSYSETPEQLALVDWCEAEFPVRQ